MRKFHIIIPMVLLVFIYAEPIQAQYKGPKPTVTECVYHDVSPPLQDIIPHPSLPKATDLEETELPDVFLPPKAGALPIGEDPVWQKENGSKGIVSPYRNFEALRNSDNSSGVAPPDSDGDIGPNHYFAMVNNVFQIFNRAGSSLYGPAGNTTIWDGWAGYYGQSISDPIVLYDEQADRWFASVMTTSTYGGNYHILCAVSTTSSPTGTWYRYAWAFNSKADYPKYGIWPDGYYVGLNRTGDDVLVLERSAMLTGATADMVAFDNAGKPVPNNTTFNCVLPSDCDGAFPAYGTPNYFWAIGDDAWAAYSSDRLLVWEFHVDWGTPTNSTWTGPTAINTAAFDATFNAFGVGEITQPGTSQVLDCIPWILMFRPQFRNFGSHYSLVCNHSVDVNGSNQAGVRWYELRKTTGGWYIRQQNTYSPDGDNRWMGSAAMNAKGDIALGYSVSSTTTYPSIRFTGRLADDPLGTMTFTESNIWAGSYSQTDTRRWGDYSMMSVDPVNDHSFWYTSEYAGNYGGWADWVTQVAAFTLDDYCAASGGCVEYISNVSIGSIYNSTDCERYSNYTNLSTNIHHSTTGTVTVTVDNYYTGDDVSIWVDWNDDDDFYDANEFIGTSTTNPALITIDPPAGAIGEHRMRVRLSYTYGISPCGISSYGEVEDYTINITGTSGLWAGTVSSNWNTAANWDNNVVPTSTVSVTIPSGTPYQPTIGTGTSTQYAYCDNLTIQSGATLTQTGTTTYRSFFYVNGNFNSDGGTFNQLTDYGFLYFSGSDLASYWDDDNEDDTYKMVRVQKTGTNTLQMWQDMTVKNMEVREGNFSIDGVWTLTVTGPEPHAFSVEEGGILTLIDETIDVTSGDVQFEDGSQAMVSGGLIRCGDEFRVEANTLYDIQFAGGTVEMVGSLTQYIEDHDGNTEFYDLVINKSGGTCYLLYGDLFVNNAMTITSGSFTLNGFEATVLSNLDVFGTLNMTNASDVLNVGDIAYENLAFQSGATGNLTAGVVNAASWVWVNTGAILNATTGNTINFNGPSVAGIEVDGTGSVFGNINIVSSDPFRLYSAAAATIEVDGNFDLQAGNTIDFQNNTMVVHGDFTDDPTSIIYVYNGPVDGSSSSIYTAKGELENPIEESPAEETKNPGDSGAKGGYLEIDTDFVLTGLMDVSDGQVIVHGHYDQAATATLNITSGSFICDGPTTSLCAVYGNFSLGTGLFEITNNHLRLNAVCTITGGTIQNGGTFWAEIDGNFQPIAGTVIIGGAAAGNYISVHDNNYFYNLTIDRTYQTQIYTGTELNIKNDFTILSGGLNTNTRDMYVGGTWDNTVGTNAFNESTGKVVFNKSSGGVQLINSDENFNILENNTSDQFRISSSQDTVTCNSYNRISGGIGVFNGTFIAYDLAQSGIFGNIYALPNSNIYLYQDAGQFVDMYADWIYVSGGTLNIIGGNDESYWCSGTPLTLDIINDGVLNFDGPGITIYDNQPLTATISSGSLKTSGWFACNRTDFNPSGAVFEFYGGNDAQISVLSGSSLSDVLINKSGGLKTTYTFKDRDGKTQTSSKSNKAYLNINDLDITGNLDIDAGTLEVTGETINCYGNTMVNNGGILQLLDNSTIALDNLSDLHVNNGGWLLTIGSAGNPVTFTHITGYYDLWIQDGGYISAEHTIFEYMSTSGVYLRPGSTVNAVNAFNNCAFQYGQTSGYLLTLYNDQAFVSDNVVFPTNTWGSGYNVYKNVGSNAVSFYNASGGFAGPSYELDPGNDVHWTTDPYEVDLKVFLEGPYSDITTKMDYELNNLGLIPTSQPFNSNPLADWYYTGPESVGSIPTFAVDWVLVELRDAPNVTSALPSRAIAKQAAFVLNNGEIVGMDGLNPLDFEAAVFNNLYVNIWHRNHLGVISANPLINIGGTYSYNFYSGSGQAYGGTSAQVQLHPVIWGILSGDGNGNGNVGLPDKDNIWEIQAGEAGYKAGDFNLDGQVNNPDKDDYWVPNEGSGSYIPE